MTGPFGSMATVSPLRAWLGVALAATAAISMTLSAITARLAYDEGTNPWTVMPWRFIAGFAILLAIVRAARVPLIVALRWRLECLAAGLVFGVSSLGYLAAIERIPVGQAALIVYVYPVLVALAARFTEQERLTPWRLAATLAAFAGLVLVLDVAHAPSDGIGIALAGLGAVMYGGAILWSARLTRHVDSRVLTLHVMAAGAVAFSLVAVGMDAIALPSGPYGPLTFGLAALFYALGSVALFAAVPLSGPSAVAMTMNLEPVTAVLLAVVLLGEHLALPQLLGGAVVIAAVLALQYMRTGGARPR
ncbi:MAG: DMT family transporter [Alphaproteobacteria bacterium]